MYVYKIDKQDDDGEYARLARLAVFSESLMRKRIEAVNYRKESGVEIAWQEDDDYYAGVDEYNQGASYVKPSTADGRVMYRNRSNVDSNRSTVFANITAPYVDMAAARAADMLLPTEDRPFSIANTPIPEIAGQSEREDIDPQTGQMVGEMAKMYIAEAEEKAEKAENQIWDWVVESGWHSEMRKVIERSARIGVGVLKGPYPVKRKARVMTKDDSGITIVIEEKLKPCSVMVDAWDIYPDPACGNDIHNGAYLFERSELNAKQLAGLKGGGYIDSQIDLCLKEGAQKQRKLDDRRKKESEKAEIFEVWHYYGTASKEDMESANCPCDMDGKNVIVSMVNDKVIKATFSVFDSGEFPYDVIQWQSRTDSWCGIGVARQVRTAQNMINAAWRNLMDNAGVSAGPQFIMMDGIVYPADGVWEIAPLKVWRADNGADINDVRNAITSIVIPSMQVELQNIITMALELAERATSMPLLLQGQQGAATDTVGGMSILQNNGNTVLRRIAKQFDDYITVPHINRYYEWLMMYGDDDSAKGDFNVIAHGSSAFYERDAQNQALMQLMQMALQPGFGINPEKLMTEILKINKISPDKVLFSEEEKQAQAEAQQGQGDPAMEVAQLKAETEMKKAELTQSSDASEIELKKQAMEAEMALKLSMQKEEHEHQLALKKMEMDIEIMRLAAAQQISVENIKSQLASTTIKLQTQKELSYANQDHDRTMEAIKPPTEPHGIAPDGEAWQK